MAEDVIRGREGQGEGRVNIEGMRVFLKLLGPRLGSEVGRPSTAVRMRIGRSDRKIHSAIEGYW
jgi:hypothetical protein